MSSVLESRREHSSVSATTAAMPGSPYCSQMRRKLTAASAEPHSSATRASFHHTTNRSDRWISSSARPRMIIVEAWEPPLPPVSMSIGMNDTSSGSAEMAAS